ncbi:MAG: hypothetical protein PVJ71_02340 [Lysobacterales bacterium]
MAATIVAAQDSGKPPRLFDETSEMQVTLSGPWRTISNYKKKVARYPAQMTYTSADGRQHTLDIEVEPRGISRREWLCDFPPLKVYFDKEQTRDTEFRGNGSLKLVAYCNKRDMYEQYNVKEFLAYRIYNLLTEYSFRVRPLMVEYREDTGRGSFSRFGFLIEDVDDVAKRNGLKKLAVPKISYKTLDPVETSKLGLFQFMIGNLDYATNEGPEDDACCHNTRLIGTGDYETPRYSIPYDFDATGLVDAHYAHPPELLKTRNIRQRLYRGFCRNNDELPRTVALFNGKKQEIFDLFRNETRLSDHNRKKTLRYLEDFYHIINDPGDFQKQIIGKCRGSGT